MATYDELMDSSKIRNNWFVNIDLQNMCKENRIIKEKNPISPELKIVMYKSIHWSNKNREFSNYVVNQFELD